MEDAIELVRKLSAQHLDAIEICLTTVGEIKDRKEELLP
jgi:hypothetical protein